MRARIGFCWMIAVGASACAGDGGLWNDSEEQQGGGGTTVQLAVANETGQARAASVTPTVFGVKLIAVYLTEDIDPETWNNVGRTEMIYLNPVCAPDLMHCDVGPGTSPEDGGAYDLIVDEYFDFAQPTEDVNAQLQAQATPITPGTYRYARAEFCKINETGAPTIRWGVDGMEPREFARCVGANTEFEEPMVLEEGGQVQVTLGYDLAQTVQVGEDANGEDCAGSGAEKTCIWTPSFVPEAEQLEGEDSGE